MRNSVQNYLMIALKAMPAQTYTGCITGTVTDPHGALIAGATVTATNEQGSYALTKLQPGIYTVKIEAAGFKKFVASGIEVGHMNETVTVVVLAGWFDSEQTYDWKGRPLVTPLHSRYIS